MREQTTATIAATAAIAAATGHVGSAAAVPIAKSADKPAVHAAALACLVRSRARRTSGANAEGEGWLLDSFTTSSDRVELCPLLLLRWEDRQLAVKGRRGIVREIQRQSADAGCAVESSKALRNDDKRIELIAIDSLVDRGKEQTDDDPFHAVAVFVEHAE